jgi:3-deoxy-D-arabino-heptulosonate 7-phosphate (DAHP) synthase class II
LNYVRALIKGGIADLGAANEWDLSGFKDDDRRGR